MKILIVDRDTASANLLKARVESLGHTAVVQSEKSDLLDMVSGHGWDIVFMDPSPITTNAKQLVMNIRRGVRRNVYMILMSETLTEREALLSGVNDFIAKPLDPAQCEEKIETAMRLGGLLRHLANEAEDYPSAGGVISKSAFNQLFLSCMDRADRYGEVAYIVFITFENFVEVASNDGPYEAEVIAAKLAQHLVRLRRQSDVIAQIRPNEYALLLLRTLTESEPLDATARFAEALSKCVDLPMNPVMDVRIRVSLLRLPSGVVLEDHHISLRQA